MGAKKGYTFRKLINDLHLWLGVASSLILFVVCLTGTIYTFRTEIEEMIEPQKYNIKTADEKYDIAELITMVEAETQGKVNRIGFTEKVSRPYEINIKTSDEDRRGTNFMVNPYTGEVLGDTKGPASEFFMTVFKLHRWLLLDMKIGRPIVGVATLIFTFLCISGLILWLPKKIKGWKSFKPGMKIMWRAKWKRLNHDLHNTLGFYSLIFLLIMCLTGLTWSFEWYNNGLYKLLTGKEREQRGGGRDRGGKGKEEALEPIISYEEALAIANEHLPYDGKTIITKPQEKGYEITKYNKDRFNVEASDKLTINAQTGVVEKTELFDDLKLGEKISKQIKGLHLGTTYGMFSKIIYFITCLIATTLPVTGIFIWINKMKPKKK
ncbi:MAG TPA: PepSY-associated TM helix domain-containing protein [Flavobacterium sp.]|nr:PepSY-associated TM helix domain-containing protein [Flavobacterium sp.]